MSMYNPPFQRWRQNVEAKCGGKMWRQNVEAKCGGKMWRQNVEAKCNSSAVNYGYKLCIIAVCKEGFVNANLSKRFFIEVFSLSNNDVES